MRPQEVYEILTEADIDKPDKFFPGQRQVAALDEFRRKINLLKLIPGLEEDADYFQKSAPFQTNRLEITIENSEWQQLMTKWRQYISNLQGVKRYLESHLRMQADRSVYIKLPPTTDAGENGKYLIDFDKHLKQVLLALPQKDTKIELRGCETGSIWVELYLGNPIAVLFVGSLAWAAAVVYKKVNEGRMFSEYVKSLKIKNEGLQNLADAQKALLDSMVEAEARNLSEEYYGSADEPETLARVKNTIREFSRLMEKGAEIHPALKAPEEVRNLFPDLRQLQKIESRVKMIPENPDSRQ